jgi:hypothetical protein
MEIAFWFNNNQTQEMLLLLHQVLCSLSYETTFLICNILLCIITFFRVTRPYVISINGDIAFCWMDIILYLIIAFARYIGTFQFFSILKASRVEIFTYASLCIQLSVLSRQSLVSGNTVVRALVDMGFCERSPLLATTQCCGSGPIFFYSCFL